MDMRAHKLKIWPQYFRAVRDGFKTCELRRADRDFQVGDFLMLIEYEPIDETRTGDSVVRRITHIHTAADQPRGMLAGFVLLSLAECDSLETKVLYGGDQSSNFIKSTVEWIAPLAAVPAA